MNGLIDLSEQPAMAVLCPRDEELSDAGQRIEVKLKRLLAATPVPARNLERRRIVHATTLQVRSEHDEENGNHYIHGVSVLRLAKMPEELQPLLRPIDLVSVLRGAGDRPAEDSTDLDLRAAAEHLRRQTLAHLSENKHRVTPQAFLGPGWRARVEIEVLNFCNSATAVVTLVTHVLIEVGRVGVFEQDG